MKTFLHPSALCESDEIGEATRIWAFSHVMKGARIGSQCNIGESVFIEAGAILGHRVTVKNGVLIYDGVQIHDDAFIGPGVIFTNDAYPRSPRLAIVAERYSKPANWRLPTVVERGASIGAGAVILPDLTIGAWATVGAGAVVTKSTRPHQLVAGNPARLIGWVCLCGMRLGCEFGCSGCGASYSLSPEGELQAVPAK